MANLGKSQTTFDSKATTEEILNLQQELLAFLNGNKQQLSFDELGDEYLNRIIQILERIESIVPLEEGIQPDYTLKVLEAYGVASNRKEVVLSVDGLLAKYLEVIEGKLSVEAIKIQYSIYPPKRPTLIEEGNGENTFDLNEVDSTAKFQIFLQVLESNNISFENLIVLEEDEEVLKQDKRMRQFPYKIIYLKEGDVEKTILISDEIGQATFIYEGIIIESYFSEYSKGEKIDGVKPERVIYGKLYREKLQKAIFTKGDKQEEHPEVYMEIEQQERKEDTKNKIVWRNQIFEAKEKLQKEANIYYIDDLWYFGDTKGFTNWPKVGGKTLPSFPNQVFNRNNGVRGKGKIHNPLELKKMFRALGLRVATPEEEKKRWGEMIIGIKDELEESANIYYMPTIICEGDTKETVNIWYFGDAKGKKSWPDIGSKNLCSFPNPGFNRDNKVEEERGIISNLSQLKKMFSILGLRVANEEEENKRWADMLIELRDKLEEDANIYYIDNIWYFGDAKYSGTWPKVGGKDLKTFPNTSFNSKIGVGNNSGSVTNIHDIRRIFMALGLTVATMEQEEDRRLLKLEKMKEVWRNQILASKEELQESINIYYIEDTWYFSEVNGSDNWPQINGRSLTSFPNTSFNKENKTGNNVGRIYNPSNLKKMFKALGFKVATLEEETSRKNKIR